MQYATLGETGLVVSHPGNRFSNFDMLQFDKDRGFALRDIMHTIAAARTISVGGHRLIAGAPQRHKRSSQGHENEPACGQ